MVRIHNQLSGQVIIGLVVVHVVAAMLIFYLPEAWTLSLFFILMVVVHGIWVIYRYCAYCGRYDITSVWSQRAGEWRLQSRDGRFWRVLLEGDSLIWPGLIILHFRSECARRRWSLLLLNDNFPSSERRRLRRYLFEAS